LTKTRRPTVVQERTTALERLVEAAAEHVSYDASPHPKHWHQLNRAVAAYFSAEAEWEREMAVVNSDPWGVMTALAGRFAGFSLEKRQEWQPTPWRIRLLPNKAERQEYRIELFAVSPEEALERLAARLQEADRAFWAVVDDGGED
jgi:hypothetical protein